MGTMGEEGEPCIEFSSHLVHNAIERWDNTEKGMGASRLSLWHSANRHSIGEGGGERGGRRPPFRGHLAGLVRLLPSEESSPRRDPHGIARGDCIWSRKLPRPSNEWDKGSCWEECVKVRGGMNGASNLFASWSQTLATGVLGRGPLGARKRDRDIRELDDAPGQIASSTRPRG